MYEAQYFTVVDIVKLIKEQPTIFDVEQLEEFKEYKKNKHRSLRYMYENRSAMKQLINRYSEEVINELLQLV